MRITIEIDNLETLENVIRYFENENIEYNFTDIKKKETLSNQKNVAGNLAHLSTKYFKKSLGGKGLDVLKLLANGYKYNAIAEETGISIDGVRYYVKKIYNHFGVNNGRDAVRLYLTTFEDTF